MDFLFSIPSQLGMTLNDFALFVGGIAFIIGILFLGISGNKRGRSWLTMLGWLTLIVAVGALGYGMIHGKRSSTTTQSG